MHAYIRWIESDDVAPRDITLSGSVIVGCADIPFKGVNGKILQGEQHQAIFFVIEAIGVVAEHSHGAQ